MSKDNESLRLGMIDLQDTIDKLNEEMREREVVMTDNFSTIQTLRRRVQDLEQYKFVLGYKAESYQAQLKPKIEEAERLNKSLQDHDKASVNSFLDITISNDLLLLLLLASSSSEAYQQRSVSPRTHESNQGQRSASCLAQDRDPGPQDSQQAPEGQAQHLQL